MRVLPADYGAEFTSNASGYHHLIRHQHGFHEGRGGGAGRRVGKPPVLAKPGASIPIDTLVKEVLIAKSDDRLRAR